MKKGTGEVAATPKGTRENLPLDSPFGKTVL